MIAIIARTCDTRLRSAPISSSSPSIVTTGSGLSRQGRSSLQTILPRPASEASQAPIHALSSPPAAGCFFLPTFSSLHKPSPIIHEPNPIFSTQLPMSPRTPTLQVHTCRQSPSRESRMPQPSGLWPVSADENDNTDACLVLRGCHIQDFPAESPEARRGWRRMSCGR
jgi:hypothetical protein